MKSWTLIIQWWERIVDAPMLSLSLFLLGAIFSYIFFRLLYSWQMATRKETIDLLKLKIEFMQTGRHADLNNRFSHPENEMQHTVKETVND